MKRAQLIHSTIIPPEKKSSFLEGEIRICDAELAAGDYLYTPPHCKHAAYSEAGCVLVFVVPQEVEIIAKD